jgi:hypothetical protein
MDKLGNIVVVKLELLSGKKVFDIGQVSCNKIIHSNDMAPFCQKPVTKVGTKESGSAGNKDTFHGH